MSCDGDTNFKVGIMLLKAGDKPRHDRQLDRFLPTSTLHLVQAEGFLCACVCVWVREPVLLDLSVAMFHVRRNASGRAARPGIKAAIQTARGRGCGGSDLAMSKHKVCEPVMIQRRDHDAALDHLTWSGEAQRRSPGMKPNPSVEMVDDRGLKYVAVVHFYRFPESFKVKNSCLTAICCISFSIFWIIDKRNYLYWL